MALASTVVRTALNTVSFVSPHQAGRGAYGIFRRTLGRYRPSAAEQELTDTAVQGQLSINGKPVHTYRWGSGGRPVLLVHGWGSYATRLSAFVPPLLERGHTVVAFDAPGHGRSGGKFTNILEFVAAMRELEREHGPFSAVIGYSFGSMASFLAVREGLRTERLVALAGVSRFDHLVTQFGQELALRPVVTQQLRIRVETDLFPQIPDLWQRFSSTANPEEIDVRRILVVHDQDDPRAAVEMAKETAATYRDRSELVVTHGLGHRRIVTDPAVIAQITAFVDEPVDRDGVPGVTAVGSTDEAWTP